MYSDNDNKIVGVLSGNNFVCCFHFKKANKMLAFLKNMHVLFVSIRKIKNVILQIIFIVKVVASKYSRRQNLSS